MTIEEAKKEFMSLGNKVLFCDDDESEWAFGVEFRPELNVVLYGNLSWDGTFDGWAMSCPSLEKASSKEEVWELIKDDINESFYCDEDEPQLIIERLGW